MVACERFGCRHQNRTRSLVVVSHAAYGCPACVDFGNMRLWREVVNSSPGPASVPSSRVARSDQPEITYDCKEPKRRQRALKAFPQGVFTHFLLVTSRTVASMPPTSRCDGKIMRDPRRVLTELVPPAPWRNEKVLSRRPAVSRPRKTFEAVSSVERRAHPALWLSSRLTAERSSVSRLTSPAVFRPARLGLRRENRPSRHYKRSWSVGRRGSGRSGARIPGSVRFCGARPAPRAT